MAHTQKASTPSAYNFRLPENMHTALKVKSAQEKRQLSVIIEEALEEVLNGNLVLNYEDEPTKPTSANLSPILIDRVKQYAMDHGVSANKLIRLALQAKLNTHHLEINI